MMVAALGACFLMSSMHGLGFAIPDFSGRWSRGVSRPPATVALPLHGEKADALFELLKPDDVPVFVGRHGDGIFVRGSPAEIRIMADFAGLLSRLESATPAAVRRQVEVLRERGTERRVFQLPQQSAGALHRLLDFSDVPVLVHRELTRVEVRASAADMRVIESFVRVLQGERD